MASSGKQQGAAFGLYRTFLFSPEAIPCNTRMGTTAAVDLFTANRLERSAGFYIPGQETGTITLADRWSPPRTRLHRATMDNSIPRIRFGIRQRVWHYDSCWRPGHSHDLQLQRQAVRRNRGRGTRPKLGTKQGDAVIAFPS